MDDTVFRRDYDPLRKARDILNEVSSYRIDSNKLELVETEFHVRGGAATVIKGILASVEGYTTQANEQSVAVKKFDLNDGHGDNSISKFKCFVNELSVAASLSHPNINQLVGFVEDFQKGDARMIFPWHEHGNVREFLRSGEWHVPERISLIKDVINGVEYMHTRVPPIYHGDLKSLNILVDASYHAIITDLGSSRTLKDVAKEIEPQSEFGSSAAGDIPQKSTSPTITFDSRSALTLTGSAYTLRWAAPEVLADEKYSLAGDIWAAGWICWEIMTDKLPFEELKSDAAVVSRIVRGELPEIRKDNQLAHVLSLCNRMASCWILEPGQRIDVSAFRRNLSFIPSEPPSNATRDGTRIRSPELLRELGTMYLLQDETQRAEFYYRAALEITHHTDNDDVQADLLRCLGELYHAQSKYVEAKEHFQEALSICSRNGNERGSANALNGLGNTCYAQSMHGEAEKHFREALAIYSRVGDELGTAGALNGLGNTFHARLKYQEAKKSFQAAHTIHLHLGNDRGCANALNGFGNTYYAQSMHQEAETHFRQAHEIHSRIGSGLGAAGALNGLGNTFTAGWRYQEAEQCFLEAQEIHSRIGNELGVANALNGLGTMHRAKSRGLAAGRARNREDTRRGSERSTNDKRNLHHHLSTVGDSLASSITWISPSAFDTSGRFSDLFEGTHKVKGRVALKRPRVKGSGDSAEIIKRFEKEATTWRQLEHPNILEFLGTFERDGHLYFVSPFIKNSTVVKYITSFPSVNRVKLLYEAADALYYLHLRNIVHGDVKGNNILISDDGHALLCDFGLTKMMPSRTSTAIKGAGSLRWMAPELWEDAEKSFETDVYAFGMTISEVLTGFIPLPDHLNHGAFMHAIRVENKRPAMEPVCSEDGTSYEVAWDIARASWLKNPSERISMLEVVRRFRVDS